MDLLRNDVSRIAQPHSVTVPALFQVQPLPAVWQMTSDVCARTCPGTPAWPMCLGALFPCVSGRRAQGADNTHDPGALGPQARGVYCGAVGVVRPDGPADPGRHSGHLQRAHPTVVLV